MAIYDHPVSALDGSAADLGDYRGSALLVVNVASKCGLTPQYAGLEALHERYADRGFSVLGFPCNQFMAQEPGSNARIKEYCSTTWGVTFPMFAKIKVNGGSAHPLYQELRKAKEELFNLRVRGATGQLENNHMLGLVRKEIARIYTVMNERRLGLSATPEEDEG